MATTNLGRVAIVAQGEYNPTTQYEKLDIVRYAEASYLVLRAVTGVEPTDGDDYSLLAGRGESAYEVAVDNGYVGTEQEWLAYIKADGSIQALQQFMTNPASTEVSVPDYGNIPSLQGYISTMFENGGLPATPFATKALMTASALVDGKYAQVTDDTVNNGLYVKTAGAWVKSNYEPLAQSKLYTDIAELKSTIGKVDEVALVYTGAYYFTVSGTKVTSSTSNTTAPIPVKKGDCYVLTGNFVTPTTSSVISMVDASGNFLNALEASRVSLVDKSKTDKLRVNEGIYSNESNNFNYGIVAPNDGFISVTITTSATPLVSYKPLNSPLLYKTDFNGFLKATQIQAPFSVLESFDGVLFTAKLDKALALAEKTEFNIGTLGSETAYRLRGDSVISERYAVTKGQFVHVHSQPNLLSAYKLVFEDAAGNFLGTSDITNEYTLGVLETGYVGMNIPVSETGYVRTSSRVTSTVPLLIGITDKSVNYKRSYLKSGDKLEFYPYMFDAKNKSYSQTMATVSAKELGTAPNNTDAPITCSKPYLIKKGEVVEYGLSAANLTEFMVVFPADLITSTGSISSVSGLAFDCKGKVINANEVKDIAQGLAWIQAGKPATTVFYTDAKKGKVAFCDEDKDVVVVFLRPNSLSSLYSLYKQSTDYTLKVYSKEEYIKVRDSEIADRFTQISKMGINYNTNSLTISPVLDYAGSYPSVLLFKGEVLSYLTNQDGRGVGVNLDNESLMDKSGLTFLDREAWNNAGRDRDQNITLQNPISHRFSQVYCYKTSVVIVGIHYMNNALTANLDTAGLIANKHYPARVIKLKDIVVGKNIEPMRMEGFTSYMYQALDLSIPPVLRQSFIFTGNTLASFVPKDSYVEANYWGTTTSNAPVLAPLINNSLDKHTFNAPSAKQTDGSYFYTNAQSGQYKVGMAIAEDSILIVNASTANRTIEDVYAGTMLADPLNPIMMDIRDHSIKSISASRYENEYKVTSETNLHIPNHRGITFNFCTVNGNILDVDVWCKVQILQDNKIVAVVNAKTANQGQSTAGSARRNIDIKFYNDKLKEVYIKFGDYLAHYKVVLKSYLNSDKGHFRDVGSCNVWHSIRTADPYPVGSVLPNHIVEDLSTPTNLLARGTPFGFPVVISRGGNFSSIATLRCKKERENYGVQKGNKNHILMQLDHQIKGLPSWSTVDLSYMEIRNPSMKTYANGDVVLPTGYEGVQVASHRIVDWLREAYNGTVDIPSTYMDYIDLESFLDYSISIALLGNFDGVINNFLLGTHDGSKWGVYWYDSDATWGGGTTESKVSPTWMDTNNVFRKIANTMSGEYKARYYHLRKKGVINIDNLQSEIRNLSDSIHSYNKIKDAEYWGGLLEPMGLPYAMNWIYKRVNYLDALYGYVEPNAGIVVQSVYKLSNINPSSTNKFSFINTAAKVGDKLKVVFGADLMGTKLTAECLVDGTVSVSHINNTPDIVSTTSTYLQIIKE